MSRTPANLSFLIENIAFTIDKPEPFPTTLIVAPIASIAVISIVLLVYFKNAKVDALWTRKNS